MKTDKIEIKVYNLRLPKSLKTKVEKQAKQESRSLNKQIIYVLEDYLRSVESKPQAA